MELRWARVISQGRVPRAASTPPGTRAPASHSPLDHAHRAGEATCLQFLMQSRRVMAPLAPPPLQIRRMFRARAQQMAAWENGGIRIGIYIFTHGRPGHVPVKLKSGLRQV